MSHLLVTILPVENWTPERSNMADFSLRPGWLSSPHRLAAVNWLVSNRVLALSWARSCWARVKDDYPRMSLPSTRQWDTPLRTWLPRAWSITARSRTAVAEMWRSKRYRLAHVGPLAGRP